MPFSGEEFGEPTAGLLGRGCFSHPSEVCCRSRGRKAVRGRQEVVVVVVVVIGGGTIVLEVRTTRDRTDCTDTLGLCVNIGLVSEARQ